MKESEWKSLGYTKQLEYVNRLETLNDQYKDMIKQLEEENKNKKNENNQCDAKCFCPECQEEYWSSQDNGY